MNQASSINRSKVISLILNMISVSVGSGKPNTKSETKLFNVLDSSELIKLNLFNVLGNIQLLKTLCFQRRPTIYIAKRSTIEVYQK